MTDFGKFGQERAQNIPELGSPPAPIYTADLRGESEEEPVLGNTPQVRRVVTDPSGSSWVERSRARMEARRSERLARLLQRVEERKQARLRRMQGF